MRNPLNLLRPGHTPTGTSYVATGIAPPDTGPELGSSQPVRVIELVPDLVSPYQKVLTYGKMLNDSNVDVSMRVVKAPILGAEFYVDPYDDQPINAEISEFIYSNLMEGMSAPFLNSIEDILHFFEDGYAVMEKVYELREWTPKGTNRNTKQYTMLKKLGVRPPSTHKVIQYDDNGGPLTIDTVAIGQDFKTRDVSLDVSKVLIFTFNRRGGDLTGKSLLRTAYEHWYYKKHFYKIDGIQKERNSLGIPKGKLLPGHTPKDREILRTMLRNIRSNEEAFIIETPGIEVTFENVNGQLVDVIHSAQHHGTMILLNVMAQFLSLGTGSSGSSGSRATGSVQSDIFMKSLKYVANYICDVVNMYLIPELVVWNYPTKSFPKLKVRSIGEVRDLQMIGGALSNLLAQGGLTQNLVTENWIRNVFDMPAISQPEFDAARAAQLAANAAPTNGGTPTDKGATKSGGSGYAGKAPNSPN